MGIGQSTQIYQPFLILHHKENVRLELARAALDEECIYEALVDIVICAIYERATLGYGSRGEGLTKQ